MVFRFLILATVATNLVFCSSFALAGAGRIRPEVSCELKVNEKYELYDIDGTSADQLRRQMRQQGTKWHDGETYAAETSWDIRYGYDVFYEDGKCSIKSVKTDLDIVYHLPHKVPSASPSGLTAAWDDYLAHLKRHEFGHKDLAVKAAAEINEVLASVGSFSTLDQLEKEVVRKTEEQFRHLKKVQIEYDNETRHGETQGAILRTPVTPTAHALAPPAPANVPYAREAINSQL